MDFYKDGRWVHKEEKDGWTMPGSEYSSNKLLNVSKNKSVFTPIIVIIFPCNLDG